MKDDLTIGEITSRIEGDSWIWTIPIELYAYAKEIIFTFSMPPGEECLGIGDS